jgi:hypothetical protein
MFRYTQIQHLLQQLHLDKFWIVSFWSSSSSPDVFVMRNLSGEQTLSQSTNPNVARRRPLTLTLAGLPRCGADSRLSPFPLSS